MFKPQNKILIIDDEESELKTLSSQFHDNGIGCKALVYDVAYNVPLKGIRIAFFDIVINPSGGNNQNQIFATLAAAIKQYIHIDNGPFALIFWTSNKSMIEDFKKFIQERYTDVPIPFLVDCIDKHEITTKPLSKSLEQIFQNEIIELLFDFENVAAASALNTVDEIYHIVPKNDPWGTNNSFKENFDKIFSKIAAATLGFNHAKKQPNKAIYEGLLPILNHKVLSSTATKNWQNALTSLTSATSFNKLKSPDDSVQRKINSFFHIEVASTNKNQRGVTIKIDKTNTDILGSFSINDLKKWFGKIIPFKNGKDTIKEQTYNNSTLIALEISSSCDYSNDKPRINKYILGFKTPIINVDEDVDKAIRAESSYHVGGADFHFQGEDFQIWLNLNFVFGTMENDNRFSESLFVLKKEIMDQIGNRYANHISRIGITSF
jgi:hypothetical protein